MRAGMAGFCASEARVLSVGLGVLVGGLFGAKQAGMRVFCAKATHRTRFCAQALFSCVFAAFHTHSKKLSHVCGSASSFKPQVVDVAGRDPRPLSCTRRPPVAEITGHRCGLATLAKRSACKLIGRIGGEVQPQKNISKTAFLAVCKTGKALQWSPCDNEQARDPRPVVRCFAGSTV